MKVIVSADDFGRSKERNRAIDLAFKKGLIESAALMVSTDFTQEAIWKAKMGGYISKLHCHLNLCSEGQTNYTYALSEAIGEDNMFCNNRIFHDYNYLKYGRIAYFNSIIKFWVVYKELCAQYDCFRKLTENKANNSHIDFHRYYNLQFPVALALGLFSYTHRIKSIRYYGMHHGKRAHLFKMLSYNPFVSFFRACNIDFFLNNISKFSDNEIVECYVHPDIVDGILLDNSNSVYGHHKESLERNITMLEEMNIVRISWKDIK